MGVGGGLKFVKNRQLDEKLCIHFYVSRKIKSSELLRGTLPKFVFNRFDDGSKDYTKKILTDVISLKGLRFACKAGATVSVIGESGALTLIFQNKASDQLGYYYAITCAHVAGDVRRTPPVNPAMKSTCCNNNSNFATTIANSTQENQHLAYDIALAQITDSCTPQPELEIKGASTKIKRFLPSGMIRTSMTLNCAFPASNIISAKVAGFRITLPITVDQVTYQVENLFMIDRTPKQGDSGGLLYNGSDAVGILVAMADNFGYFQPLGEAFEHIKGIFGKPVQVFQA
ncbi:hypothetical protein EBAPG3_008600 [Nitrosospira lacus]|uniref:Peptidase S1 domain-containing protein n=2 Tax=Nitrosospira lacus TaxID=1288494 RepID=A0A1W6SPX0_9PROT|nr:hypothetical protein EBAPG3_008600 [Nitrosospira lacus]